MKLFSRNQAFTLLELMVVIAVVAILITIAVPHTRTVPKAFETKSLSNAKEIVKGCIIFASEHNGRFPNGSYNKGQPGGVAGKKSYECFTDVIQEGWLKKEEFYWNPKATHVCTATKPNENGKLETGECAYDYIGGMTYEANGDLPLVFEACTMAGTKWDKNAGHPWDKKVIVARVDGSGYIMRTDQSYTVKVLRPPDKPAKGAEGDLIGAVTAAEGFPAGAFYAPAK